MNVKFSRKTGKIFKGQKIRERLNSHGRSQTLTTAHVCRSRPRSRSVDRNRFVTSNKPNPTRRPSTKNRRSQGFLLIITGNL
jgi:hypothetical protein